MATYESPKRNTQRLVIVTAVAWVVWDVCVYLKVGGAATISTVFGEWMASPYWGLLMSVVLGGIVGHFVKMMPADTPFLWLRVAVLLASAVVLWAVT